jgi:hypothetical protein
MATSFKPTVKVTRLHDPTRSVNAKDKIAAGNRKTMLRRRSGHQYGSMPASPVIIDLAHEREIRNCRHEARRPDRNWIQAALIMLLIAVVVFWTWL